MQWCPLHYESVRLWILEGLARELQEFCAPEHWAKVVLNEAVFHEQHMGLWEQQAIHSLSASKGYTLLQMSLH